jgi:PAS domain S-box-containing protein
MLLMSSYQHPANPLDQQQKSAPNFRLSGALTGVLIGAAVVSVVLLCTTRKEYPELHPILDMGLFVLSGVLALFFWNVGIRLGQRFSQWIAAGLAVTWILDGAHMAITVEWPARVVAISQTQNLLLSTTWALPTYILPAGIGMSLWLLRRNSSLQPYKLALALLALSGGIMAASFEVPRHIPTGMSFIRPTLVLTPVRWVLVGAFCWRWREAARTLPWFALMAVLLCLGDFAMLYSHTANDTAAILAHLGKFMGSLVMLISKMQMASTDLVERFRAEAKFRGLLESAPDAIVVVNATGKMTLVNSQTEALFGYKRDELIGRAVEQLIPARFRHAHPTHVTGFFATSHARPMGKGLDLYGLRQDGSEFPVEISLSPLETEEGVLVSAAIRDVSSRKQSENEIRRLNQSLEERAEELAAANKELEAFTYTAAHDLRAPLRHMHGYSTFLKEAWYDRLDDEGRHFLDRIITSTKGMATLLDELLNFSRLGRVDMQKHEVRLADLVERIRADLGANEPDAQRVRWEVGVLPEVEGDISLLHQVLVNLLSNAIKYSRKVAEPQVLIGSQYDEEAKMVTIFVRDNGAGFDMQYGTKLFQVFQRLHRPNDFEGTGIGLAIVRRIVERHGGKVWAEGVVGQGATFYFSLPEGRHKNGQARIHSAGR